MDHFKCDLKKGKYEMKGHIRERSPGHWAIVLEIRDPETGNRKRKWHSFAGTKREAQIECSRLIVSLGCGTYLEPNKLTLAQFFERWLDHVQSQISPKSRERYSEVVRKNIIPAIGAVPLTKLRPAQISQMYAKALANGRRDGKGGLAPTTVVYMHRLIKHALAQAVRWELLSRNPAEVVDPPKVERATSRTAACTSEGNACNGCAWARPPTSDASEIKPRKRLIVRLQKNEESRRFAMPRTPNQACRLLRLRGLT
jgi:hypothetical protein